MALFKVYRGNETNLPSTMNDGWAYFCTDSGNFYIDWDNDGVLIRTQINANYASNLKYLDGEEAAEIDATTLIQGFTTMWQDITSLKNNKADVTALSGGISEAKSYTNTKISDEVAARAAAIATLETKTDASAKLTEAKAYTDQVASGKANSSHGLHVPTYSASNNGQFLRVVNGAPAWSVVPNAEEATF